MRNLALTGGGTAGHCIPCLALLPYLEKHFDRIIYIGSENGPERALAGQYGLDYFAVPAAKLRRSLSLSNLKIPFVLVRGVRRAEKILKEQKISAVFSKGGYVSLPVAVAAGRLDIPLVIHESDLSMGLANRLAARYATEILTSFPVSFGAGSVWTGAPINGALFGVSRGEGRAHYGITGTKPVLLVMGGSSGSLAINREIGHILDKLVKKFNVLHLYGKKNSPLAPTAGYFPVPYENDMKYAYAAADVALTRGGSNCLFELLAMKIPALIVPLPKDESRGDQIENARFFEEKGAFRVMMQDKIVPDKLYEELCGLYDGRLSFILAAQRFDRDANAKIAQRIVRASLSRPS